MATGSGKGKSRKRALEVLDKLPDGATVTLPQDDNGDIKGESLAEILAAEAEPKKTLNPDILLAGIAGILEGTITSGEEVLKMAEVVVDEKASVEDIKPEETAGDAAQESDAPTETVDPVTTIITESDPPAEDPPAEQPTAGGKTVEEIMAELGLGVISDAVNNAIPEIKLPERSTTPAKAENAGKAGKASGKSEKSNDKPKAAAPSNRIPIDAPIPAAEFRGHKIGVYGNILEPLEQPDANGYAYSEIRLERYNATAHESFRKTNGRMVLLYPQGGGVYLVVAELPDGTREPVIEVTNSGRGRFRCRQIATAFRFAYVEKKDEVMIKPDEYATLKAMVKAIPVVPVTPPAPAEPPKAEEEYLETPETEDLPADPAADPQENKEEVTV